MKQPSKNDIITGCTLLIIGMLILVLLPKFLNVGWYAITFGVTFYFFPGPQLQLTDKFKQKELGWQSKKATRSNRLSWWATECPWFLLICLVLVILAIVT